MAGNAAYESSRTGLLLVDPYNDFLSDGGVLWPRVKAVAEQVGTIANMKMVLQTIRTMNIQVFIVPHHRWELGDYSTWKHPNKSQLASAKSRLVAKGSWGGEWHPDFLPKEGDVIIKEHWAQSGFANTDLDHQLKQHGVQKVILIGLIANTCIESTGRFAMELGYHVTLVKDATAAYSQEMMYAAHDLNGPTFAHAILSCSELIEALRSPGTLVDPARTDESRFARVGAHS